MGEVSTVRAKGRLLSDGLSKKRFEFPKVPLFDELLGAQKPAGLPGRHILR